MKGVVIDRALPSNILDLYALFKAAVKEGAYRHQPPTDEQLKSYYFALLEELAHPRNLVYLARKGRQHLGFIQAQLVLSPWGGTHICFIKMHYVLPKKRKLGIGKKLLSRLSSDCKAMGVSTLELMCHDEMAGYWSKQKAKKVLNLMVLEAE